MSLIELTSREAVLAAIKEYEDLGEEAFLSRYGFGRPKNYVLEHDGKRYGSKAIAGVAYGKQFPDRGPLLNSEFSGGEATVKPLLEALGFRVLVLKSLENVEPITSADLKALLPPKSGLTFSTIPEQKKA